MRTLGLLEILLIAFVLLLLFGGRLVPRLGASLGTRVRTVKDQARWVYQSMGGTEAEEIQAEEAVGKDLAREFRAQNPPDPDASLQERVNRLGARLAATALAGARHYSFEVVASPVANAYALPGGHVFVTRRLVDLCSGEDEVAFVLAHEMGHIVSRHFLAKYTVDKVLAHVRAGQLIGQLLGKGYSREQEYEADRKGAELAKAAGFSSTGALSFFRKLAVLPREASILAEYFSTHPRPADRISHLRAGA